MTAVWAIARSDLGRRGPKVMLLALLVAVTGGIVTASVVGAERSRTSLDRFIAATNAADVGLFGEAPPDVATLEMLDTVETASAFSMPAMMPEAVLGNDELFVPVLASLDGRIPGELNGVRVIEGRLPDASDADAIMLHEATAAALGVGVGDAVPMVGFTPEAMEEVFGSGGDLDSFAGPRFELRVVALVRDPLDVISREDAIVLTPITEGVVRAHGTGLGAIGAGAFVQLADGATVEAFTEEVRASGLEVEIERWIGADQIGESGFGATLDVIGDGLLALAVVVGVAGAFVFGQAVARGAGASRHRHQVLGAIGLSRRHRSVVAALPGVTAAAMGSLGAVAVAVALSGVFPIGVARRAEVDPGTRFGSGALLGGATTLLITVSIAMVAVGLALRGPSRPRRASSIALRTPGVLGPAVARSARATSSSTRVAVAVGAVGVSAALVFASSLDALLSTPARYGWPFDAAVSATNFDAVETADGVNVAGDPAVAEVAETIFNIEADVNGSPVFAFAIGDGRGEIAPVVASGQRPRGADDVALGRQTMRRLGVGVGDTVEVVAGDVRARFSVVGQAIIPVNSDGNLDVGDGMTMTLPAARRLGIDPDVFCRTDDTCYRQTVVRWRDDADLNAARDRLLVDGAEFEVPRPPAEVERLSEVEHIPWLLAALLGVLATTATVHAAITTVTRRRKDLAVMRALGATPAQTRVAVVAHTTVLVLLSATVGTLAGIALGRVVWRNVAGSVGVAGVSSLPVALLLALPFAAVAMGQSAAIVPAVRAGRLRPGRILRRE